MADWRLRGPIVIRRHPLLGDGRCRINGDSSRDDGTEPKIPFLPKEEGDVLSWFGFSVHAALVSGSATAAEAGGVAGADAGAGVGAVGSAGAASTSFVVRTRVGLSRSANACKPGVGLVLATARVIALSCWVMRSASWPTSDNVSCRSTHSSCILLSNV